jgi:hypothetical protein
MGSATYPEIRRSVLGQRWPLVAYHAFAAPRVVVLTVPARARTPQSRPGVPCVSTDESRLVREFRGQTDSVSERNCFIIEAGGGDGFLEAQFSRSRATAYGECVSC